MTQPSQPRVRSALVMNALLLGVIIGLVTAMLGVISGSAVAVSIISGGVGFGATVPLALGVMKALGWL